MKKHYWEYGFQDKETRRKYNTGDIFENAAECLDCGDYIRSNNRHDYKKCSCGKIGVDGGSWYAKRTMSEGARYKDIVVPYPDGAEGD